VVFERLFEGRLVLREHGGGRSEQQDGHEEDACARPGRVLMVEGEADICESLEILFHTTLGERVMQPDYGADLKNQVFEPMNATRVTFIEDLLRTAIVYHEPRIEVLRLSVETESNDGRLSISIDYQIRGTNSRFNFVYPFYLNETGAQP